MARDTTTPAPSVSETRAAVVSGPAVKADHSESWKAIAIKVARHPATTEVSVIFRARVRRGRAMNPAIALLITQKARLELVSTIMNQMMSTGSVVPSPMA